MKLSDSSFLALDPSKLKKDADLYRWADFIELSALTDKDGEASLSELLADPWGVESGIISDFVIEEDAAEPTTTKDEKDNRVQTKIIDLEKYIKIRKALLGDAYPFDYIPSDKTLCQTTSTAATASKKLYTYLLLAANLPFFKQKSIATEYTTGFERLAYYTIKSMLPQNVEIRLFGTAATGDMKSYRGRKTEKFLALAEDIGVSLTDDFRTAPIPRHDSGDGQIDIAAWLPFKDNAGHCPLFLSQAGCTADEKEMLDKQHDVSPQKWQNRIRHISPTPIMLSPACYRRADGNWVKPHEVISVFLDRVRIVKLLEQTADNLESHPIPMFNNFE